MDDLLNKNLDANNADFTNPGSLIFNDKNIKNQSPKNIVSPVNDRQPKLKTTKDDVDKKNKETATDKPSPDVDKRPDETKLTGKKDKKKKTALLAAVISNQIWLSVSEAAKIGGVRNKTIRRAIQAKTLKYKVVSNRYLVDLSSVIIYLNSKTKLKNKLNEFGIGQYVKEWAE